MKKLLLLALAATITSTSAMAYDQNGPERNASEYSEQFHWSWEDGQKHFDKSNWNDRIKEIGYWKYPNNDYDRGLHHRKANDNEVWHIQETYGNIHAYYQVYKSEKDPFDLTDRLFQQAANGFKTYAQLNNKTPDVTQFGIYLNNLQEQEFGKVARLFNGHSDAYLTAIVNNR